MAIRNCEGCVGADVAEGGGGYRWRNGGRGGVWGLTGAAFSALDEDVVGGLAVDVVVGEVGGDFEDEFRTWGG